MLVGCGDSATPTSAPAPTTAPAATVPTTQAAPAATATPVVLASLPPAPTPPASGTVDAGAGLPRPTTGGIFSGGVTPRATPSPNPTPQTSPAPISAFNLKTTASFGLDQKTVRRITSLLIPTAQIPPSNRPGINQGVVLGATSWKLAPPLVWCESSADKLKAAWALLSFKLMLDDQAVDLKQFPTVDFQDTDSASFCRAIDLALGALPQGIHRIVVTRTLSAELETGPAANPLKLAPGDYVYRVELISLAPNPNVTTKLALTDFQLGSSTGTGATYQQPAESFSIYSDAQEQFKPGTFKYTAVLFAEEQYGLLGGWCAKDQATLDENWKKMTYNVSINGQSIPLTSTPQYDRKVGSQSCRFWDLNMTAPEGQYQIIIKLNFSADTNDGVGTYLAGDYISEYTVLGVKLNP